MKKSLEIEELSSMNRVGSDFLSSLIYIGKIFLC